MLKPSGSYWRDGHGVTHMLLETSFLVLCTRKYRPGDTRVTGSSVTPTCLQCIAEADQLERWNNGEPVP